MSTLEKSQLILQFRSLCRSRNVWIISYDISKWSLRTVYNFGYSVECLCRLSFLLNNDGQQKSNIKDNEAMDIDILAVWSYGVPFDSADATQ